MMNVLQVILMLMGAHAASLSVEFQGIRMASQAEAKYCYNTRKHWQHPNTVTFGLSKKDVMTYNGRVHTEALDVKKQPQRKNKKCVLIILAIPEFLKPDWYRLSVWAPDGKQLDSSDEFRVTHESGKQLIVTKGAGKKDIVIPGKEYKHPQGSEELDDLSFQFQGEVQDVVNRISNLVCVMSAGLKTRDMKHVQDRINLFVQDQSPFAKHTISRCDNGLRVSYVANRGFKISLQELQQQYEKYKMKLQKLQDRLYQFQDTSFSRTYRLGVLATTLGWNLINSMTRGDQMSAENMRVNLQRFSIAHGFRQRFGKYLRQPVVVVTY